MEGKGGFVRFDEIGLQVVRQAERTSESGSKSDVNDFGGSPCAGKEAVKNGGTLVFEKRIGRVTI